MAAFYNEIDPFAAAWLRELIKAGHIAAGIVCEKDIRDIVPADLDGFTQCHFFAGVGVWSYALRLAGWPDDRPVWTGSCPCQPFSAAGRAGGFADERHLWPALHYLIEQSRPSVVFGEQVASKDGLAWLDLVQADMEGAGYSVGALDLCAAGVGAPHIRQRLYFGAQSLGNADGSRREARESVASAGGTRPERPLQSGAPSKLADADDARSQGRDRENVNPGRREEAARHSRSLRFAGELADADAPERRAEMAGRHERDRHSPGRIESDGQSGKHREIGIGHNSDRPGPTNGAWRDADWLYCRDGRWRPVRPGSFPLAHRAPARVGRLRGYGNAIVAQAAAEFIAAYSEQETHNV